MKKEMRNDVCELCGESASVYCSADSAFLCWPCDGRVHQANFLVARHVRRITCAACLSLSGSISASGSDPIGPLCPSCRHPASESSYLSSSAAIEPSTPPRRKTEPPMDTSASAGRRTLGSWSRRIGGNGRTAGAAARVIRACVGEKLALPLRASMAAALYHVARASTVFTWEEVLRRLERCSGVPARVIVDAESRIARAVRRRGRMTARASSFSEEGWAECS